MAELALFNIQNGFTEALIRGLRCGILSPEDYRRVSNADTLEDVRSALEETDYGTFLQDEPSPLLVSTISRKCYERLADEFRFMKAQCNEPLTTFFEFIQKEKMIDNVVMIIQGSLNGKAPADLQEKLHPMGHFDGLSAIMTESFDVQGGFEDVYNIFLIDSPIGSYFEEYLKECGRDKDEMPRGGIERGAVGSIITKQDLELMKATLKKAWLEEFYAYTQEVGGTTGEVMGHILKTEADFRTLLVTLNALNTELSSETHLQERNALYPSFGYLYPEGVTTLRKAWNETSVRAALEPYAKYLQLYDQVKQFYEKESGETSVKTFQSMEDLMYTENCHLYEMAFEQQYHFGVFYAWTKLKEQEVRNIRWIANMIVLQTKDRIDETIVPIFQPRM